jgi:DNA primase
MGVREQVRERFRVAREMGDEFIVPCPHPDHEDNNPSASINVSKRKWVCYACGRGGLLEELLDGYVADERVEDTLVELSRALDGADEPHIYPERWLHQFDGPGVHPYWLKRGLSEAVCVKFRLGYDVGTKRVTYPLRSSSGAVLGVVRRAVGAQLPKYQYPEGVKISETLFGYYLVRTGLRDLVLVEGALDAIAMWDVGVPAVAQMGARLSRRQIELLRALGLRTLTLAYDQDQAGREAVERALTNPLLNFCHLRLMTWRKEEGKDPLDLDRDQRLSAYENAELVWGGTG